MEKLRKGQFILIATVILLTLYNVLPTIIFYSKPLSKPIEAKQAYKIAEQAFARVDNLQDESIDWLKSFTKHLGIKPKAITHSAQLPKLIEVTFFSTDHAKKFKTYLPRAGSLIPFMPAQLSLSTQVSSEPNKVIVERRLGFTAPKNDLAKLVSFIPKKEKGGYSDAYQNLMKERLAQIAFSFSKNTSYSFLAGSRDTPSKGLNAPELIDLAQKIKTYNTLFELNSPITRRFLNSFAYLLTSPNSDAASFLASQYEALHKELTKKCQSLKKDDEEGKRIVKDIETISYALQTVKENPSYFKTDIAPLSIKEIKSTISINHPEFSLGQRHPFIEKLALDFQKNKIYVYLHQDVDDLKNTLLNTKELREKKDAMNQLLINEVAKVSQALNEKFSPTAHGFEIILDNLQDTQSYLAVDLGYLANNEVNSLKDRISSAWKPTSPEFANNAFPIWDYPTFMNLPAHEKKFGLVVYAPLIHSEQPLKGFDNGSIYVIMKGLNPILQKYQQFSNLEQAENFKDEFSLLQQLLNQTGFQFSYLANENSTAYEFKNDFIFEHPHYYAPILAATRENFSIHGNKQLALLELTDLEQRILTANKIDCQMHEELIKWNDDYHASLVDLQDTHNRFSVPPPIKNIYVHNFLLSLKEYFRGDHRKIIKWGLDLSGGKSILIALKDQNNKRITEKADLNEAVNELTQRVNKMGLSEVDIRVEGQNIALDFPSSKGFSASELIKGSSMSFHIVNEKFASKNSPYFNLMQRFLQEVWNESVITNKKDTDSLQQIAWKHLGGQEDSDVLQPQTEYAKELYQHGFRLAPPHNKMSTSIYDNTLSSIGVYRGEGPSDWHGQGHPLIPIFNNYALTGADIEQVRTSYDPTQGNVLTFNVKGSSKVDANKNPRKELYHWTSEYAKDKILGTGHEKYTVGRGWRMAIILNGHVINDPQLNQPLSDNILVSGGFTQLEADRLAADLKAGSLSFTPQILFEENVSADLGYAERLQGISATAVALLLVVFLMTVYYRFSGIVASIAVLFNLLIMWGVLQNLGATLTLSGIAGIILTVGMAVDANVLVFERIREELRLGQKLSTAISIGYKKAFSAILDSNVTTIIAAVILLSFDTGPIKGLAVTLTIGIASSMFTALFMTQSFFNYWVGQTKAKTLQMANWFQIKSFAFLKHARWVSVLFLGIIIMGATLMILQHRSIVGMDFTGGYSVNIQVMGDHEHEARKLVTKALQATGIKASEFQIRELGQHSELRIQLSSSLEEKGRPFYNLPIESIVNGQWAWQKNPRISWLVQALDAGQIKLTEKCYENLDKSWTEMSGQLSKTTRNNAMIALALAMMGILIYISFRYEIKYALSAILCTLHDVLITLAFIAILHFCNVPIQINMQIIAALMTIIGYSLNDTIIVFDRIREERKLHKKLSFEEVINQSISVTLNRTMMTSLTTLIVVVALVILGGAKIFDFSLVMSIGIVLGTLSSLFVAPLFLQYFNQKEKQKEIIISSTTA